MGRKSKSITSNRRRRKRRTRGRRRKRRRRTRRGGRKRRRRTRRGGGHAEKLERAQQLRERARQLRARAAGGLRDAVVRLASELHKCREELAQAHRVVRRAMGEGGTGLLGRTAVDIQARSASPMHDFTDAALARIAAERLNNENSDAYDDDGWNDDPFPPPAAAADTSTSSN